MAGAFLTGAFFTGVFLGAFAFDLGLGGGRLGTLGLAGLGSRGDAIELLLVGRLQVGHQALTFVLGQQAAPGGVLDQLICVGDVKLRESGSGPNDVDQGIGDRAPEHRGNTGRLSSRVEICAPPSSDTTWTPSGRDNRGHRMA